jgi:DNA-binding response OmpR family regulator
MNAGGGEAKHLTTALSYDAESLRIEWPFKDGQAGVQGVMTKKALRIALVVEDDPILQRAMIEHLETYDFEVRAAYDYDAAVRHLEAFVPDVACVDLGLPSESGYSLCEHVRRQKRLAGVPILVTSERGFPEDMAHAEEAGANAFLRKPFTMKQLTKYVNALLDGPHPSRPSVRRLRLT